MMEKKIDQEALHGQHPHWEKNFSKSPEMFGENPSEPAKRAAELFKKAGKVKILELGGGQGRDTIFFAQNGFHVYVVDYTEAGIEAIKQKAQALGLSQNITAIRHDVKEPLPFANETFDACYSHMLFCMALTTKELEFLCGEIRRVLNPGGLNIYTVRNTNDAHYTKGIYRGEDLYENSGFIVHFFSKEKVEHLAKGFDLVSVDEFEEGDLPRKLYSVITSKPST